jgi:uroporphyrinogen decarboxylase
VTLRDSVKKAFRFEEVRPTPYTVWYDQDAQDKLNLYYGCSDWQTMIQDHILRIDLDWRPKRYIDEKRFVDIHGTLWQEGKPLHLVEPVLKEPSLEGFNVPHYGPFVKKEPAVKEKEDQLFGRMVYSYGETRRVLEKAGETVFKVVSYGPGLLESAWMIRGYEEFFSDLVLEPAFAHELLDVLAERQLEVVGSLSDLTCDAIMVIDDFGDQRGIMIGPQRWRDFIKPRLARIYDGIHKIGKMTFHHSCGSVFDIIPDLIDTGLDVLQSLQPEAMPVYAIKKRYGQHICLWGGLGTQRLLPFGTPEEVRAEVRKLKQELGKGGGYVFSSSKPIMGDVPVENAVALIEEAIANNL